ncbi:MAG: hypothetical protein JXB39_09200, partial [Deltaproteobacteria bacterium]|nr:hypothetical protein [Deltaproteobacteria bacterium]
MRLLPLLCLAACDSSSDTAVEDDDLDVVARVGGFEVPESVLCDEDATCYVSNIVGNGADEDGDGYLSRITPDGVVLDRRWTSGVLSLDAPKGMAIVDGVLYVVDITRICALEIATSTPRYPTAVDAAAFLNDVAAGPDGTLYLTDTANGQVFAWDRTGEPEPLHEPGTLDAPNG